MSKISDFQLDNIMSISGGNITITNSFSINMLSGAFHELMFTKLDLEDAQRLVSQGLTSYIGHADMAAVVGGLLEKEVPMCRETMKFHGVLLVAQYTGPRLPEGTTVLPEGAAVEFWLVEDRSWYN